MSISSSSASSSSVSNLIEKFNKTRMISCVLGMSSINFISSVANSVGHSALLLIDTLSEVQDDSRGEGILIEYGKYWPDMNPEEAEKFKDGKVIYRYGKDGGLRYYGMEYQKFLEEFGTIGYISMDIDSINQITFENFLNICAPISERKWICNNYDQISHNCQTFTVKALGILKPKFIPGMIQKGYAGKNYKKKIDILPACIKDELNKLK